MVHVYCGRFAVLSAGLRWPGCCWVLQRCRTATTGKQRCLVWNACNSFAYHAGRRTPITLHESRFSLLIFSFVSLVLSNSHRMCSHRLRQQLFSCQHQSDSLGRWLSWLATFKTADYSDIQTVWSNLRVFLLILGGYLHHPPSCDLVLCAFRSGYQKCAL